MNNAIEMASCRMMCLPSFMKIGKCVHAIFRFFLSSLRGCSVGITDGGIYELRR
jgi:hypothetical protein